MIYSFIKLYLHIYIFFNILTFINCKDEENYNFTCDRITINKNGIKTIEENIISAKEDTIFSMKINESFVIYNCENDSLTPRDDENSCMHYYNYSVDYSGEETFSPEQTPSINFCNRKNTRNKDNICCHYIEKNNEKEKPISICIELNKYEIQRFKWIISIENFDKYQRNQTNNSIVRIECNDEIYKLNKYIILFFFIIFINF